MNRVYLDTDVLLDFLYQREPFFQSAVKLIARLEEGKTRGYVSTLIIWNLLYLLEKEFGRPQGKRLLRELRSLLQLVAVDEKIIDQAFPRKSRTSKMLFSTSPRSQRKSISSLPETRRTIPKTQFYS